jgi:hypothetical protein
LIKTGYFKGENIMATPTNLPASFSSAAVLTAAQQNDLRGAFRVLQVVTATTTTITTSASTTYAASGLSASITPQSASSKILVMTTNSIAKTAADVNNGLFLRLRRGSTVLQTQSYVLFTGTAVIQVGTTSFICLDSPSTTSSITYDVQFANYVAASQVEIQSNNSPSTMILMEISA